MTGSAIVMSSLFANSVLPIVIFGPMVGVFVDRIKKKRLLWISDFSCVFLVSLIPILNYVGILEIWHLYAFAFILSILSMLFDVATKTLIPNIVIESKLTQANSIYQTVNQLAIFWDRC